MRREVAARGHVLLSFVFCVLVLMMAVPEVSLSKWGARHDRMVLQSAKTAVIAWTAARYEGRAEAIDTRLGEMVMPDKDAPTAQTGVGTQDGNVSIGRLPWKTLGAPPLFDAHGEWLWYTVSSRFRDNGNGVNALHCRALQQLVIYALGYTRPIIAEDIAAMVIAPHRPLATQQRHSIRQQQQAYQYIESAHKDAADFRASKHVYRHLMQGNRISHVMNDQLLPIECRVLERMLAKRRGRENG